MADRYGAGAPRVSAANHRSRTRSCRSLECSMDAAARVLDNHEGARLEVDSFPQRRQAIAKSDPAALKRYDCKPKRLASRKLYVLQGLPGVGPALANRLLVQFGSIQAIVAANEEALIKVPGVGRKKAARIRELVR